MAAALAGAGNSRKRRADFFKAIDIDRVDTRKVPPYDPSTEQAPRSVILSPEWKVFESGKQYILELITSPFEASQYKPANSEEVLRLARSRLLAHAQEDIVVSLTGNMGCGKSATLNSLLQVGGGIAREGDSGSSCTLATNKFQAAKKGQQAPFLAEVFFFQSSERRAIIEGYFKDYCRAHNLAEDAEGSDDTESNPAIKDEVAGVMASLFKDQPACRTKNDVREFLEQAESEDDSVILNRLITWADSLVRRATNSNSSVELTASTAGEMLSKLEVFCSEISADDGSPGASLWPLVSLVNFHFDDPLTKLGITFMDTPGVSDHNRARKASAMLHSKDRTHALVVTAAARAQDDPAVASEVRFMSSRGLDRVVVVSPKSDSIGDSTMPQGSKKEKEDSQRLKNMLASQVKALTDLEDQITQCDDDGDDEKAGQLSQRKRKMEVLVKMLENDEKAHRIQMRSEQNKTKLQAKLKDVVSKYTKPVPVFAVSNKCYAEHLVGYAAKSAPVLTVEETNIPDLRRLISTFPNEARLNEARHLQNSVIPGLIRRLALYTSRTPFERKQEMEKYLNKPLELHSKKIKYIFRDLAIGIQQHIVDPLREMEAEWIQRAVKICSQWEERNKSGPFLSLMNRQGFRRATARTSAVNMSGELAGIAAPRVSKKFSSALPSFNSFEESLIEDLTSLAGDILYDMREDCNYNFVDLEPFFRLVEADRPRLNVAIAQCKERVFRGMVDVEKKAMSADPDGYIVQAMEPIFEKVRVLKQPGKNSKATMPKPKQGWPQLRKDTLRQEIAQVNGIWAAVYNGVQAELSDLLNRELATLSREVFEVFDSFKAGFATMCDAKIVTDPQERKLQEQLEKNLKKAEEHLGGKMQKAVDVLLRDYR